MRSNYKKLGPYIQQVNIRNSEEEVDLLLGVSIQKIFIPSIANTVGTNMKTYKIIKEGQFAYGPVTSRNGDKISVALLDEFPKAIVSQAYTVFEVIDEKELLPEYLMMWFRRPEFDRYARFMSHGSARETFDWEEMCEVELPVPSPEKQQEIVEEYNTVVNRIKLNEELNQKLEETAQSIYKHWFEDFEFPISKEYAESIGKPELEGKRYRSNGGQLIFNKRLKKDVPINWNDKKVEDFLILNYGKSLPAQKRKNGPYKVYSSAGVSGMHDLPLINEPCIIVGRKGSIGTLYFEKEPCYCIDTAYFILENEINVPLIYAYWMLKQMNLPSLNEDSAVPGLSRKTVYEKVILVPDKLVLAHFGEISKKFYDSTLVMEKENEKLETLADTILRKMTRIQYNLSNELA